MKKRVVIGLATILVALCLVRTNILSNLTLAGEFPRGLRLTCIAVDGDNIWFGTGRDGVKKYHKNTDSWVTYTEADGLICNRVKCIVVDSVDERYIWFGTDRGIGRYDKLLNSWESYLSKNLGGLRVITYSSIAIDPFDKDSIWIGTDRGLIKYNRTKNLWEKVVTPKGLSGFSLKKPEKLTDYSYGIRILVIIPDRDHVWCGTEGNGLYRYLRKTKEWEHIWIPEKGDGYQHITSMKIDSENKNLIWLGTRDGICCYDMAKDEWKVYPQMGSLAAADIFDKNLIWSAKKDTIWKFTIRRLDKNSNKWSSYNVNLEEILKNGSYLGKINSIAVNADSVWIATWGGGIIRFDKKTNRWRNYSKELGLGNNSIDGLIIFDPYNKNIVYFGMHVFDRTTGKLERFDTRPYRRLLVDKDYIWYSHTSVLGRYIKKTKAIEWNLRTKKQEGSIHSPTGGTPSRHFTAIARDAYDDRYIWLGASKHDVRQIGKDRWVYDSTKGYTEDLCKYDKRKNKWTYYPMPKAKTRSPDAIVSIAMDVTDKDYLWIGTKRGNVYRFDKEKNLWIHYKLPIDETKEVLQCLVPDIVDKKYIWIGTTQGLFRFDRTTTEWKQYTTSDGLVHNTVKSVGVDIVDPKYIWLGTPAGVNKYNRIANKWVTFNRNSGMLDHHVLKIAVDSIDRTSIWVDTEFGGLHRYDRKQNSWFYYDKKVSEFKKIGKK